MLEISGKLDDPEYIKGLDKSKFLDAHENVFSFSSHLASMEVLQMLTLFIAPSDIDDVGQQLYHFVLGTMDIDRGKECHENCFFQLVIGKGDLSGVTVYGDHKVAVIARRSRMADDVSMKSVQTSKSKTDNFIIRFLRRLIG